MTTGLRLHPINAGTRTERRKRPEPMQIESIDEIALADVGNREFMISKKRFLCFYDKKKKKNSM